MSNLSPQAKAAWAWFCGIAMGPIGVYTPYFTTILKTGFGSVPAEAHSAALTLLLGGLGLVNMKKPRDHKEDQP
jgi:hypothetical protein